MCKGFIVTVFGDWTSGIEGDKIFLEVMLRSNGLRKERLLFTREQRAFQVETNGRVERHRCIPHHRPGIHSTSKRDEHSVPDPQAQSISVQSANQKRMPGAGGDGLKPAEPIKCSFGSKCSRDSKSFLPQQMP